MDDIKEIRICEVCGNVFITQGKNHKYCSTECFNDTKLKEDYRPHYRRWLL
jgi:hypothetical protein